MHILITGGAGFIGSHLAERLMDAGHSVAVLDDLSTGTRDNLEACRTRNTGFEMVEDTILDPGRVTEMVAAADVVFHLAAAVGVKLIMDEPSRSILTNVTGTENVLRACVDTGTRVFVASTSEVYGKASKFPFQEDDDLTIGATVNLRWSYACAKTLDEFLTLAYVREKALPATVLRFFNTTGPRQTGRYGMVLPSFVTAALKGDSLLVHGSGQQSRCFCHVADVVEALMRLLERPETGGRVYNIGTDQEVSIHDLARKVVEMTGSSSEVRLVPYDQVYAKGFEDMMRRLPDVSRLEAATGFRPRLPLEQIIADVIEEKRGAGVA